MSASAIIFYVIAAFILGTGLLAVTTRKIFRSAIWLLFSLIGIAGLYFWLQVEFIAAVQIVVYVGGIVVLIIFSIFLTQQSGKEMPMQSAKRLIFSALAVLLGFALTFFQLWKYNFKPVSRTFNWSVSQIGNEMLRTGKDGYALPFEVVSVLLLAAMVGCIVIAMRQKDLPPPPVQGVEIELPVKLVKPTIELPHLTDQKPVPVVPGNEEGEITV